MSPPTPPAPAVAAPRAATDRLPRSIAFLAWNEAAERFSYYGMTSILALHLVRHLRLPEHAAVAWYQLFTAAVYLLPIAGAWIADRAWGRYRTILWLSLGYVVGHAVLAVTDGGWGLAAGLALIAVGAGGIKPCASAFAGDQIDPGAPRLLARVYDLYYWMINLGSTASTLLIPWLYERWGGPVAFGAPAVAMALALAVFLAGRRRYVRLPPAGATGHGLLRVLASALRRRAARRPGRGWLDGARLDHGEEAVAAVAALGRIAEVFAAVAAFWALFFQYGSSWTLQAERMRRDLLGHVFPAGQVQTLDAVLVLLLIPAFSLGLYPALARRGLRVTALGKMTAGMFVMVLSFAAAAGVERALEAGLAPHVAWQLPQYLLLAIGEVLVSVTALEFAYGEAPPSMKSAVMGLWYLTISAGSLLTALVAALDRFRGVAYFAFFAVLMLAAALAFARIAARYRPAALRPRDAG